MGRRKCYRSRVEMKQRGADLPQLFQTSVFLDVEDSIHISTFNVTAVKKMRTGRTIKTTG